MAKLSNKLVRRRDRRHTLTKFREEVFEHPGISFAFSLFWVWVWTIYQNDIYGSTITLGIVAMTPWFVSLLFYAVGFFTLGTLFFLKRIVPRGRGYFLLYVIAMTVGASLAFTATTGPIGEGTVQQLGLFFGCALMGLGTACLHVEWGRILGCRGERATLIHCIVGTVGAALLYAILSVAPPAATKLCVLFIPPLSAWSLQRIRRRLTGLYAYEGDANLYVPWKFIGTSLIQGLSFGVMWGLLLAAGHHQIMLLTTGCFALAAIGLFVTAILFKMDFNHLIYQVGFLVMAGGYVLFIVAGDSTILGSSVNSIGCHFMSILMWSLCAFLINNRKLSANWVFTWTTGSYIFGQALGTAIATEAILAASSNQNVFPALAIVMTFIILASALFMLNSNNLNEGWGLIRPGARSHEQEALELACQSLAREYDLTPREEEVLQHLAHGRNRHAISERLILSPNTIKTHIRNIYQKMNVHSQQEIMSLVEKEAQASESGGIQATPHAF